MTHRCVWWSNLVREEAKARQRAVKYTHTRGCVAPGNIYIIFKTPGSGSCVTDTKGTTVGQRNVCLTTVSFYILLTVHLGTARVNNQLDARFNVFISLLCMFRATQCSSSGESVVSIHHLVLSSSQTCITHDQENQLYQYTIWYWVPLWPVNQTATYTEWYMPYDVLIQLILLMMSTGLLETCREVK